MRKFFLKMRSSIAVPLGWTVLTIILLCLPGSTFPSKGLFDLNIPHLDKVVHVILFGGIILFWCQYFYHQRDWYKNWRFKVLVLALSTIILGIVLEYIQFNYIPNRSFDRGDILANSLSTMAFGLFFYFRRP